jgi:DNA-binding response OmpR family regulator
MPDILIADDDIQITTLIEDSLVDEGFTVAVVHDGEAAVDTLNREQFKLILLDIMMPGMDGLEVCKKIRDKTACPILFVTAKSRTLDTVIGLELGGDDYITKPFVVEELVAKVKAHIRRDKRNEAADDATQARHLGNLRIFPERYEVFKGNEEIELSTREFQLLMYLHKNIGQVLTREQIFDEVWGLDYSDIGTVTVTIKNLRDKIDPDNNYIKTVWGVGYKLVKPMG